MKHLIHQKINFISDHNYIYLITHQMAVIKFHMWAPSVSLFRDSVKSTMQK